MRKINRPTSKRRGHANNSRFVSGATLVNKSQSKKIEERKKFNQERARIKRVKTLERTSKKIVVAAVSILLVVFVISRIHVSGADVSTQGGGKEDYSEIENYVADYLDKSIFNKNKLSFDKTELERELQKNFSDIESAQVNIQFLNNRLQIIVAPRSPFAVWISKSGNYLMDKNGVLFIESDSIDTGLIQINDTTSVDYETGSSAISPSDARFISEITPKLEMIYGAPVDKYFISDELRSIEAKPKSVKYSVYLDPTRGVEDQVEDLKAAISFLDKKSITVSEYIDIRIDDKALYK